MEVEEKKYEVQSTWYDETVTVLDCLSIKEAMTEYKRETDKKHIRRVEIFRVTRESLGFAERADLPFHHEWSAELQAYKVSMAKHEKVNECQHGLDPRKCMRCAGIELK